MSATRPDRPTSPAWHRARPRQGQTLQAALRAGLDEVCARRRTRTVVGTEEGSRRGSNQRSD
jgi:hypothetical protein